MSLSEPHELIDIREWRNGHVVVGGGGILHESLFPEMKRISESEDLKIAFGIGVNSHHSTTREYPDFLSKFDLVGLREVNHGLPFAEYVPCPSCLHPEFDNPSRPQFDFVIYEHWQHPSPLQMNVPRMRNDGTFRDTSSAIRFLASGDTVITNSYHGAYWAALLGGKVLVHQPFSNRFLKLPFPHQIIEGHDWRSRLADQVPDHELLSKYRELCISFMGKIEALIRGRSGVSVT